jgi:hypothetical protein
MTDTIDKLEKELEALIKEQTIVTSKPRSQKFVNKHTGEIATVISLMEISDWEKYTDEKEE